MKEKLTSMLENFALIKLFFALFTSFLLYEEFFTFLIEKPTHTSSSKGPFSGGLPSGGHHEF